MVDLILASTSPARRALLDGFGLPYRAVAPGVDEVVSPTLTVEQMVATLAKRKARAVLARFPNALVIGADQLVSRDGSALGKPEDAKAAALQLRSLCGREHDILTGVCVVSASFCKTEVDVAHLTVRNLSEAELAAYVALGEWQGCAGGYRIEARGQALFSKIDGDRTSIQGLPMQVVIRLLLRAGVAVF